MENWAILAAENSAFVLPYLTERGEPDPVIDVADIARRIETTFHNQEAWNQAIHESGLDGYVKLWLIVPSKIV